MRRGGFAVAGQSCHSFYVFLLLLRSRGGSEGSEQTADYSNVSNNIPAGRHAERDNKLYTTKVVILSFN